MSAQVKIFHDKDIDEIEKEINAFLKEKNLKRDHVTIKQSESAVHAFYGIKYNHTITLLFDN